MAYVRLKNVFVEYPIYTSHTRALKTVVISRLGGQLAEHARTTIVQALSGISLKLTAGDRLCVIGSNGSGKTTLLRLIAGVYTPQRGSVKIRGSVSSFTDVTLGMDMEATGWENIIFRCIFMGLTFGDARQLAPSIAEFSELEGYLDLPVRTYSSGMLMRLAFAIVTSAAPDIIIMDEMIGTGDALFLAKAERRLADLLTATKIFVLATHNTTIAKLLCNKALWLDQGRIRRLGSADAVLAEYLAPAYHDRQASASRAASN